MRVKSGKLVLHRKRQAITHWDYRVVFDGKTYEIREVYYNGMRIVNWGAEAVGPRGEDLAEIRSDLMSMAEALKKPVLDLRELETRYG